MPTTSSRESSEPARGRAAATLLQAALLGVFGGFVAVLFGLLGAGLAAMWLGS